MSIEFSFVDSAVYGTDDINKITNSLVGAGVSPFVTADTYNVSDINGLNEAIVGSGVQMGGCKCSVSGAGSRDTVVTVSQGTVFFESGVRLEVDAGGYDIPLETNTEGYVFANFNPSLQVADILFGAEVSAIGESVVLAHVSERGIVTDLREIAKSKVATMGNNIMKKYAFQRVNEVIPYDGKYVVAKVSGVDVSRFNVAFLASTGIHDDSNLRYFPELGYYMAVYDLNENTNCFSMFPAGDDIKVKTMQLFYKTVSGYEYYAGIVGGELCILCKCDEDEVEYVIRDAYGCTACLM